MADNENIPRLSTPEASTELPSSKTLLRWTVLAAAAAALVLTLVVLPSEYGVDPTGLGRVFGLTQKGEAKVALAKAEAVDETVEESGTEASADSAPASVVPPQPVAVPDTANARVTSVTLQPGEGKEVKLVMRKGARARYAWSADGGGVNYLTHGDTANAPANSYHTYGRGSNAKADSGAIVAAFDGMHGWFWRNRAGGPITVTLRTSGDYQDIKQPE